MFTKKFSYLRSVINFLLDNTEGIKNRINKVIKLIRALKFIQDKKDMLIEIKIKLYTTIL